MRREGVIAAEVDVDVPFHDVDMAAVVWHGHYLKYLENARWALMERIGFGIEAMLASGYLWPIVELQVKYVRASRYGDRLRVRASLVEWESRLAIHYLVHDRRDAARVARARTVQVAVGRETGELLFQSPPCLTERVREAIA